MSRTGIRAPVSAVVSDFDRTLSLRHGEVGGIARRAVDLAHAHGLKFVIASGREREFLERIGHRLPAIDGFVAENGCVLLVRGKGWSSVKIFATSDLGRARDRLADAGLPETAFGDVIVSVRRAEHEEVAGLLHGLKVDIVANVDRLMIVPEGVTKLSGTMSLLDRLDLDPWGFAAIGDGENDYELLAHARISGAPRNAVPRLREMATFRSHGAGPRGVLEFVQFLAGGERKPGPDGRSARSQR